MEHELAQQTTDAIATVPRDGSDEALATLLSLTSDAVLLFDFGGRVTLANDEAVRLFRAPSQGLVGTDVRKVFSPAATPGECEAPLGESLPFALDGTSAMVVCASRHNTHEALSVRCEAVYGTGTYLLVAHLLEEARRADDEHERLVEELSRANRRLSGTLRIVLGTLDSLDVGTLFSHILDEVAQTMDAWVTLAYVAEQRGYRLRGASEGATELQVPQRMTLDHPLALAAAREARSLRMHVRPPSREELRSGIMGTRTVAIDETGEVLTVEAAAVPPFASFVLVPVWFGGRMISLLEVGWRHVHRLGKDDTRLLDAVAEYLSVQLAGAFAALRTQHAERLESLGTTLRERLLLGEGLGGELLLDVFAEAGVGIGATVVPLMGNPHQRTTMADLPSLGQHSVPLDLASRARAAAMPMVTDLTELGGLASWLEGHGEPAQGVLAELGLLGGVAWAFLLLRGVEDDPLEDVDVSFVRRLAEDVCEVAAGERVRTRDKRIAEALQMGMRNELQHVDGLTTQSCYSSATEAASVGGDFYDLVRLPERRACIIMGDVSGKGVEAASVSSAVKTALGAYAWEGLRPARMVALLNDFLLGFSRVETFATMFVGIVDLAAGRLAYCSAGHPPALLVRAGSGELVTLGVQSGVVGAFEGLRYEDGETDVREGDVLVLYTDGVTEARNAGGAFFGEDGLRDMVASEVSVGFEGMCGRMLGDVEAFTGNSLEDDVALVVVRFDQTGTGE